MEEQRIYGEIYESPVGALTILAGEKGIQAIESKIHRKGQ